MEFYYHDGAGGSVNDRMLVMATKQDGPKERAARSGRAGEALTTAAECKDPQVHASYLRLAEVWNAIAAETEFLRR